MNDYSQELTDEQILNFARHAADRIPFANYEGRVLHAVRMALAALPKPQVVQAGERGKIAPVQGWPQGIPWSLHLEAYAAYCKKWSPQPALIDLEGRGCRGGFGISELDEFIPGWRDKVSEIYKLRAEIARLTATLPATTAPAPVPAAGERERFEAWMCADGNGDPDWIERTASGDFYVDATTTAMFTAWQARAALPATTAPEAQEVGVRDAQDVAPAAEAVRPSKHAEWLPGLIKARQLVSGLSMMAAHAEQDEIVRSLDSFIKGVRKLALATPQTEPVPASAQVAQLPTQAQEVGVRPGFGDGPKISDERRAAARERVAQPRPTPATPAAPVAIDAQALAAECAHTAKVLRGGVYERYSLARLFDRCAAALTPPAPSVPVVALTEPKS